MAWRGLTDRQWKLIQPHLPPRKINPKGGRPWADDRKCFEGILWILWTGAPWSELPRAVRESDDLLAEAQGMGGERRPGGAVARLPGATERTREDSLG